MIKFLNKIKGKKEEKPKAEKKDKPKEGEPVEAPAPKYEAPPAEVQQPAMPQMPMYPYPYFAPQASKSDDKEQRQISMEVEKMKALMSSFSESRRDVDEKLRSFAESLGEIRSMFFQREQSIKDMQVKIEGMSEVVGSLKPEKIAEERSSREKDMALMKSKLERLDKVTSDLLDRFAEIRETLEGLKSLKAIVDISRDVGERLLKMEEIETKMERMSSRLESTYLELNKHLVDIPLIKSRTESLDKLSKEIMAMIEDSKRRIDMCITREEAIKLAPAAPTRLPSPEVRRENVEELKKKRDEIKGLMATLEKEFKDATITEDSYKESMEKSQLKLKEIEGKIAALEGAGIAAPIKKGISKFLSFGRKKEKPQIEETETVPEEPEIEEEKRQMISQIKKKEIEQKLKPEPKPVKEYKPQIEEADKPRLQKTLKKVVEIKKKKELESKTSKEARSELMRKLKLE